MSRSGAACRQAPICIYMLALPISAVFPRPQVIPVLVASRLTAAYFTMLKPHIQQSLL